VDTALPADAWGAPADEARGHGDSDLRVDALGNLYYYDPPPPPEVLRAFGGPSLAAPVSDAMHSLAAVPVLHSNPAAPQKLFLDFNGHIVEDTDWNAANNNHLPIHAPPFDIDGNPAGFSEAELNRIERIWARVAEDFAPLDIDVTTEDPGAAALSAGGQAVRALITTNYDDASQGGSGRKWFDDTGGVAYIGSWQWRSDTPVWVFSNNLDNGNEKFVAESVSHELGHALGLSHDGVTGGTAYYEGHGSGATSWAPIMGSSYWKSVTQWDKGQYPGSNQLQNDLAVMTSRLNGIQYRSDDHGNWDQDATPLLRDEGTLLAQGIIERSADTDVFSFATPGGSLQIDIDPAPLGPNLDIYAELLDESGNTVAVSNPQNDLRASFSLELEAGEYFLLIEGDGNGDFSAGGYTDYGSLGGYSVVVGLTSQAVTLAADAGGPYEIDEGRPLLLDGSGSAGTGLVYAWDLDGDNDYQDAAGVTPSLQWADLVAVRPAIDGDAAYDIGVRIRDGAGNSAEARTTLSVRNVVPAITAVDVPSEAVAGLPFHVTAEASDPAGAVDPLEYTWDFGDASPPVVLTDAAESTHVFAEAGTYDVRLTVADDDGAVAQTTVQVRVSPAIPRIVHVERDGGTGSLAHLDRLEITFNADVGGSLEISDLVVFNRLAPAIVDLQAATLSWEPETNTAVWVLSALALPPGQYDLVLQAAGVSTAGGVSLDGDADGRPGGNWTGSFAITLPGDLDGDLKVDFADLVVLSDNYGGAGGSWSRGDFDGDGRIDFRDFIALVNNFGRSV
jgi:hypothetical protein